MGSAMGYEVESSQGWVACVRARFFCGGAGGRNYLAASFVVLAAAVSGVGFRVAGVGCRVEGLGLRV